MNKIKEELLKTVGNVTKQKQHVIVEVEKKLEQGPKQRKSSKWVPVMIAVFALIAFMLVSPKLLQQEPAEQLSTANFMAIDDHMYDVGLQRMLVYSFDEEDARDRLNSFYVNYILMDAYAKHQGVDVTQAEIDAVYKEKRELYNDSEDMVMQQLVSAGFTQKDYEKFMEHIAREQALEQKLLVPYADNYKSFTTFAHEYLLELDVNEYFFTNFEEEFFALYEELQVHSPLVGNSADHGVVLDVTDDAVLYLSEHERLFSDYGAPIRWAPLREGWNVQVGDTVTAYTSQTHSVEENNSEEEDLLGTYPKVALVHTMDKHNRSLRIEVTNEKFEEIARAVVWKPHTVPFERDPDYIVTDNLRVTKGYLIRGRQYVTWINQDGLEATVSLDDTLQLLLEIWSK